MEPSDRRRQNLCAEIRNAEAAILGFCQLAAERVIQPEQAMAQIREAVGILTRARSRAEASAQAGPAAPLPAAHRAAARRLAARPPAPVAGEEAAPLQPVS